MKIRSPCIELSIQKRYRNTKVDASNRAGNQISRLILQIQHSNGHQYQQRQSIMKFQKSINGSYLHNSVVGINPVASISISILCICIYVIGVPLFA